MNSRAKGKRGEREFAAFLREHGFDARRGQQFAGGADSPDIVCELLDWLHIEVKRVERLNLIDACTQAEGDASGKHWIVTHRRNNGPWFFTGRMELLFDLIRGVLPPDRMRKEVAREAAKEAKAETLKSGNGAQGLTRPTNEVFGGAPNTAPEAGALPGTGVFGGSPNTTGGSPVPPNQISAAACAAANNHNNTEQNGTRVTRPSNEKEK